MITIWKKTIKTTNMQRIEMPMDAEILTVQQQNGNINIWFKVDTEKPKALRELFVFGTGHPMPKNDAKYIGTYQLEKGIFIFHVFDNGYVT